jgi:uncharacterized membrane protein YczE
MKSLNKYGFKVWVLLLFSHFLLGVGVSILKMLGIGNDPYNAVSIAVSTRINIPYVYFHILLGLTFFIPQLMFGKKYIGLGTIINIFTVSFFVNIFDKILNVLEATTYISILFVPYIIASILATSIGLSMYQNLNVGVAPYDSLSLIIKDKYPNIPYGVIRVFFDGSLVLIAYLFGGIIGIGTLVTMLAIGPCVQFFDTYFCKLDTRGIPTSKPTPTSSNS